MGIGLHMCSRQHAPSTSNIQFCPHVRQTPKRSEACGDVLRTDDLKLVRDAQQIHKMRVEDLIDGVLLGFARNLAFDGHLNSFVKHRADLLGSRYYLLRIAQLGFVVEQQPEAATGLVKIGR